MLSEKLDKFIEAGMISLPVSLYGASEEVIRKWSILAAKNRGLEGANLIRHPFRYASSFRDSDGKFHLANWYFGYHLHFMGFFKESYNRCRECEFYYQSGTDFGCSNVSFCDGFEQLTRRLREKDGFVMKVFDKRESYFKSALYELSHSGFKVGDKRACVSSWFGNCKVKVDYVRRKLVCPEEACKSEFVPLWYSGNYEIVKSPKSPDFERDSWMPLMEEGKVVWHAVGITSGDFVYSSSGRIVGGG